MSSVSRRAFLAGVAGAAAAGWLWIRDSGLPVEPDPEVATRTEAPPSATASPTTSAGPGTTAPPATTTTTTSTTAPPAVLIAALCRESWAAAEPTGDFTAHIIERLTVHHTARLLRENRDAPAAVRGHQRFHQLDRGWADIAYHFIIDLEGNVYECRPVDAVGDTGTNYDPTGHFLVCCEGNFNEQDLPEAMRAALVDVLAWAAEQFDVGSDTIAGHRDWAATSCPGDNLYPLIESGELAAAVDARIAEGGAQLEVVCGEEAAERVRVIEA